MTLFLKNLSPNVGHYFYTRRIAMSYEYEIAYDISKLQEWEHVGEGFVHEDKRYALLQSKKHAEIGVWLSFNNPNTALKLSLIHISEPTRRTPISYAVFCLKKK